MPLFLPFPPVPGEEYLRDKRETMPKPPKRIGPPHGIIKNEFPPVGVFILGMVTGVLLFVAILAIVYPV